MPGKVNRDCFYRLASDLQDERVKAAVSLIEELSALELPACNEEWSYVLKRLISGLASGRNSARLGFSLCLSEVVKMALDKGTMHRLSRHCDFSTFFYQFFQSKNDDMEPV